MAQHDLQIATLVLQINHAHLELLLFIFKNQFCFYGWSYSACERGDWSLLQGNLTLRRVACSVWLLNKVLLGLLQRVHRSSRPRSRKL